MSGKVDFDPSQLRHTQDVPESSNIRSTWTRLIANEDAWLGLAVWGDELAHLQQGCQNFLWNHYKFTPTYWQP